MKEEWRPCKGYEGFYEVSNMGRVRSIAVYSAKYGKVIERKTPRLHKLETSRDGYKRLTLSMYGDHKHWFVHRLVALAFIPNPENLPFINHKDEDTKNNNVSNLEWCTGEYNSNYGTLPRRIAKRMNENHPTAKTVFQYKLDGAFVTAYPSCNEAARCLGTVSGDMISRVCRGQAKTAGGYFWKYAY